MEADTERGGLEYRMLDPESSTHHTLHSKEINPNSKLHVTFLHFQMTHTYTKTLAVYDHTFSRDSSFPSYKLSLSNYYLTNCHLLTLPVF